MNDFVACPLKWHFPQILCFDTWRSVACCISERMAVGISLWAQVRGLEWLCGIPSGCHVPQILCFDTLRSFVCCISERMAGGISATILRKQCTACSASSSSRNNERNNDTSSSITFPSNFMKKLPNSWESHVEEFVGCRCVKGRKMMTESWRYFVDNSEKLWDWDDTEFVRFRWQSLWVFDCEFASLVGCSSDVATHSAGHLTISMNYWSRLHLTNWTQWV